MNQSLTIALLSSIALFSSWFMGRELLKWVKASRAKGQIKEVEQARKNSQAANQKAQAASDALKKIDRR